MPKFKKRPRVERNIMYRACMDLTGKSMNAVRLKMTRLAIPRDFDGFIEYIKILSKEGKILTDDISFDEATKAQNGQAR